MHPWEDWAETWAHYLHITDALGNGGGKRTLAPPERRDEPALRPAATFATVVRRRLSLMENWFPLTYVVNNLNRGLGMPDGYPFVLSPPAVAKLRFVHDTIAAARSNSNSWSQTNGLPPRFGRETVMLLGEKCGTSRDHSVVAKRSLLGD